MRTEETVVIKWRDLVKMSLLFGVGLLYVSVIGMVETFNARVMLVGIPALGLSGLTVGRLLLFSIPWLVGFFAMRWGLVPQKWNTAVLAGASAGAITTLWIALMVISETALNQTGTSLRNIFVNISPNLLNIILYGQNVVVGLGLLLGTNVLMGILGATYPLIPDRPRRAAGAAFATVFIVGLFGEIFTQLFRPIFGNTNIRLFFQSGALTPLGIALTFIIGALGGWFGVQTRQRQQTWVNSLPSEKQIRYRWAQVLFSTILLILLPWLIGSFLSEVAVNVGIYIMMALGLNIAIGLAGLLDLGYVTNYAVGAYIMAIFTSLPPDGSGYGLNFWLILPLCMLGAMITGFVLALPVLRMRGDYLAIATLGFGEIIRILAISDWLSPFLGGAQGILYIPKPSLFGFTFGGPQTLYYIVLAGVLFVLYYLWRLNNSRTGRQWMAIREDEDVAEAMGINLVKTKVLAFTVSAAAGGLAGGIFAAKLGTVFPQSFNAFVSINVLSIIIVGGMGSIPGIIVGGIFLVGMPEILREFAEYRMLIYGALLVLMMLQRPEGLIPSAVRERELKGQNPDDNPRLEHDLHRAGALDSETTIH